MTRRMRMLRAGGFSAALLLVFFLEMFIFSYLPLSPMLLPVFTACIAVEEGSFSGGVYGLAAGILFDAFVKGEPAGVMTLLFPLLGIGMGLLTQYILRQNFAGSFLCSVFCLFAVDSVRICIRLFLRSAAPAEMLSLAGREILLSLLFMPPIRLLLHTLARRLPSRGTL